jgi:alkylation response protein AidB-like acyl-CoA dehydrogenase
MDTYQWWTKKQIELAKDVKKFTDEILIPLAERDAFQKKYSHEALRLMGPKGWFGCLIPEKYGGHAEEWGITGATIITDETSRAGWTSGGLQITMFGSATQLVHNGNDEQKQKWLPSMAKGELHGCITMTEPYAGSDIASIETTAVREGDYYIINGKKRFQTASPAADLFMSYFLSSKKPEDRASYRHLTAIVVEKGTPGFHIERINDTLGYDGFYNAYLSFDNAKVPVFNRLGNEGDGWKIMMSGLNVERILNAAPTLGPMLECIRYAQQHLERRIQFGQPTGNITVNQFKLSDMISKYYISRLLIYYSAYCADLGKNIPLEAAASKLYGSECWMQTAMEAVQCMGGNGILKIYPVERMFRDAKHQAIAAGTSEVLRLLIYRQGTKIMKDDLKVPLRAVDRELGIPISLGKIPTKMKVTSEDDVLKILAENYRVNPGLHMTIEDIQEWLEISNIDLIKYLESLEKQGFASCYRNKQGIGMAKVTYTGLQKANPPEYYRHCPDWVDKKHDWW